MTSPAVNFLKMRFRHINFRVARLLITNAFLLFLSSALLLAVLYAAGNAQLFFSESLLILLKLLYWNGILLFVFAMFSIFLEAVLYLIRRGVRSFYHIFFYALFAGIGIIMTIFAGSIIVLSKGKAL